MKKLITIVLSLILCSCATKEEMSSISLENHGYNGNQVVVLREGRLVTVLRPLSHQGLVFGVEQVNLNLSNNPYIQAYQTTYHGNGSLAVYESSHLGGLQCVFATRGYDTDMSEGITFKDSILKAEYSDVNKDGYTDIIVMGELEHWGGEKGETHLKSTPFKRVFLWKKKENSKSTYFHEGHYEEVIEQRISSIPIDEDSFYNMPEIIKELDSLQY